MKWLRHHAIPLLVIVLITCVFFLRLFFPTNSVVTTPDFGLSDAWNFSYPAKFFLANSLNQGQIPLWNSLRGMGVPVHSEGQQGTFFLPNLILYSMLPPIIAYNSSLCLIFIMFGIGTYFLLYLMRFSRGVALFGAISLTFSGIFFPQLPHFTHIQALSLLPWILSLAIIFFRKPSLSIGVLLALCGSQQFMCGFPQTVVITWILVIGFILYEHRGLIDQIYRLILIVAIMASVAVLSAIQLLPSQEFIRQIYPGGGFSQQQATYFSFSPKYLSTFLDPFILGNPKLGTSPPLSESNGNIFWENSGNVGLLVIVFFVLGFIQLYKTMVNRQVLFFGGVLVVGLLLAFGKYSPLYFIHSFWPLNLFRVPARFIFFVSLSLTILGCVGLKNFLRLQNSLTQRFFLGVVVVITFLNAYYYWHNFNLVVPYDEWNRKPAISSGFSNTAIIFSTHNGELYNQYMLKGWGSPEPYLFLNNALGPNTNTLWGIYSLSSYDGRQIFRPSLVNTLLESQFTKLDDKENSKILNLFAFYGITHIITPKKLPEDLFSNIKTLNYTPESSVSAYQIKNPRPRAYFAQNLITAKSAEENARLLSSPNFFDKNSTLVETDLKLELFDKTGEASVVSDAGNELLVEAINPNKSPQLLVVQDTYYPGWKAYVNDTVTQIYPVNIRSRGVIVPSGKSTVVFKYLPSTFVVGALISIISHLIAIGLISFPFVYVRFRTFLNRS